MSGSPVAIKANSSLVGTAGKPAVRGGALDTLRFVAAFFVVAYHYAAEAPIPLFEIHPAFDRGYLATDFFLILSGFVLGRAYGKALDAGSSGPTSFFVKRAMRIWPAHLMVLALTVAVVYGAALAGFEPHHEGRFETKDLLPQALLIQAWGNFGGGGGWNLPTWSLSALIVCYAAFPVLWRASAKVPGVVLVAMSGGLIVGVDAFARYRIGQGIYDLTYQFGVLRALPMFILGASLARLVQGAPTPRPHAMIAGFGALAGLLFLQLAGRHDALSIVAIAVAIASFGSMPIKKPSALAAYGGKISFSLFITHVLAAVIWFGVMHVLQPLPAALHWAFWAGSFVFALAAAALFERLIDAPVQAFLTPKLKALFAYRPFGKPQTA